MVTAASQPLLAKRRSASARSWPRARRAVAEPAVAIAVLMLTEHRSHAASPAHARANLAVDAPPSLACPGRDRFASSVATRLGYDPFTSADDDSLDTLHVRFAARGDVGRSAELQLLRPDGSSKSQKQLDSGVGDCEELAQAAAFSAAVMLDPRVMFQGPSADAPARGETLESNAPGTWPWYEPRSPLPHPQKQTPPAEPWRLRAGLEIEGCAACAPRVAPGAGLFFGVGRGHFGADAGVRADLPVAKSTSSGKSVRASLVTGELFPHARFGVARVGALMSLGSLFGDSDGERQTSLWAACGARGAMEPPVAGRVFLRAAVDALASLARVSLRAGGEELWSTPILVGRASVGVGVEVP